MGTKGESFASDKDRALKRIEEGLERSSDKYIFLHNRYKKKKKHVRFSSVFISSAESHVHLAGGFDLTWIIRV